MLQTLSRRPLALAGIAVVVTGSLTTFAAFNNEWKSGIEWPEPAVVDPGPVGGPPADAIVLFDGTDLSQWKGGEKWTLEDGYGICGSTITSKQKFGDCQLHVEFASPPEVESSSQGRGNSGIYLMGRYELQILDSYENETYYDGQCGAVYKQRPPLVNACRPPGEWQTYDIIFKAPRFDDEGAVTSPATITVLHNGVLIQDHFELLGGTAYHRPPEYKAHGPRASLAIQHHGDAVRFRNIWIRDLMPPEEEEAGAGSQE
ncbi:hypothetical protein Mal4_07740 [Maioricimonas rarisocia]|uniref:3-keto-alpha-glucoside-1,2-lyase/3-keto-2-hydroxy-glucal hydratase domain-containing protein n=1 Tax=Maioricimonas rarisocia TaxID=2528026 RepID=A0A517Z206_9PLAN|nr:DUF1080 domain-containing protein [Maioricimonas rarisocia]QDU36488.1 hypothetical protein Mal4_07740 [Maioricimonas rarisocia]